jgi:endonuclease G
VPLPLVKEKSDLVQVERASKERPFELRYQHFSVIVSRSRRFCCITGVNSTGTPLFSVSSVRGGRLTLAFPRRVKSVERNSMSSRFSIADIWSADSIPCGGGSTARLANTDTHHYTNSCPQVHSVGSRRWRNWRKEFIYRRQGSAFVRCGRISAAEAEAAGV